MDLKEFYIKAGKRLHSFRDEYNLSLSDAAKKTGYSKARIGGVEHAKCGVSLRYLFDMCEFYGIDFADFVQFGRYE